MTYPEIVKVTSAKKVTEDEAFTVMEGDECSRIYFRTDKIIFTVSTLLPGQKSPMDDGHNNAHEIVYCIAGEVVIHFPDEERYVKLKQGDAVCIPAGANHMAINVGNELTKMSWSLAPDMGK